YCCRAAGRIMDPQGSGAIVNIASINGQNPAALVAAHNVAKAGVISLTPTLALELAAYGARVNAVYPGPAYTEFNRTVMARRGTDVRHVDIRHLGSGRLLPGRPGRAGMHPRTHSACLRSWVGGAHETKGFLRWFPHPTRRAAASSPSAGCCWPGCSA